VSDARVEPAAAGGSGRALVLHPHVKGRSPVNGRRPEARLQEAEGLARAIALEVVEAELVPLGRPHPATLIGSGKVEALKAVVLGAEVDVAVIDGQLTPVQQRNLEKAWNCKVIDRTGLILEIFGARARTAEGRLQVELARLTYDRGRLVRTWTHLERQRGGLGAVGGPGESQLEADRRALDQRIVKLKQRLEDVGRTRELHRKSRRQMAWPVVALVGYTNAGKSTLFNRLTAAEVLVADQLFATLDPTMRLVDLGGGQRIVVSDTVGFVSDLPTHLIAAFRATLEEVLEADLVLHVRDIAHPDSEAQRRDVEAVLRELGIDTDDAELMLEVLNKVDLLDEAAALRTSNGARRDPGRVAVSALTGAGMPDLLVAIAERLGRGGQVLEVDLDAGDGTGLAWLYRHARVLSRADRDGQVHLKVQLDPANLGRWLKRTGAGSGPIAAG
jgi:GTP-binding protein HflX